MRRILFGLLIAALPATANAEGFYVGILGGASVVDTGISESSATTLDDEDTGVSVFAGREFGETYAVEAFYADFGKTILSGNRGDTFTLDGQNYEFVNDGSSITGEITTYGIAGKARFEPYDDVVVFAKAGLHSWSADYELKSTTINRDISDDGIDYVVGVGAEYKITNNVGFLVGYDGYKIDTDSLRFLYAGVKINF